MVERVVHPDMTADEILAMDKQMIDLKAKRIFWTRMAGVLIALAALIFVVTIVWVVLAIRATQINGTPTGKAILETNQQLKDCLQVSGECYKRSQANQSTILGTISDRTVYAITCAQDMPDAPVRDVLACVDRLVTKEKQ